ncbi:MAG: hypothetical protein B0D92_08535 [Spirochaeta sp. LUC14_002_19_P3]|nr:MAG: hypothetical protein B0D92_08535 [Spirochaeta sp. LUC14_002_19_P3]
MEKKMLYKVLHYGSLWGIAEATLGYVLHAVPFLFNMKIAGAIMFPVGAYCMFMAFSKTDKTQAIFLTALVAAVIKSINFFMPSTYVYNQIIAIIAEGLAVWLIMPVMFTKTSKIIPLCAMGLAMSAVWRVPFIYLPYQFGWIGLWQYPAAKWVPFITTDVFFNGILIALFIFLAVHFPLKEKSRQIYEKLAFAPLGAFALFAIAVGIEYLIK